MVNLLLSVYINSVLVTLNARNVVRATGSDRGTSFAVPLTHIAMDLPSTGQSVQRSGSLSLSGRMRQMIHPSSSKGTMSESNGEIFVKKTIDTVVA